MKMLKDQNRTKKENIGKPQHPNFRDFPYYYMIEALSIFKEIKGKTIVEIGSMRRGLNHDINELNIDCCMDGHSSLVLAQQTKYFFSVDVDQNCVDITKNELDRLKDFDCKYKVIKQDGISFLNEFDKKIDLLFLDAWDVDLADSSEKHLEAYEVAKSKMAKKSLILIDDTDVDRINGQVVFAEGIAGKGKLVVPKAIQDGWTLVFSGRQTLLKKGF